MAGVIRSAVVTTVVSLQALSAPPAFEAGPYTDDLSKCLVRSITSSDRALLAQWTFAAIALHPDVKQLATLSDADRIALTKRVAGLYESLLTRACASEARHAVKYGGNSAMAASTRALGLVTARELLENPSVHAGLAELGKFFDAKRIHEDLESSK